MFVRLSCLLLFALNLGAAAWLLFGKPHVAPPPPPTDPGVPELQLVNAAAHSARAVPSAPERCTTLGPFDTDVDMRAAMQTLSPHVSRIQYRMEQVSHSHGYWVYLPAAANREGALAEARQLTAKGIGDYYVVTAGDQQNTISLGLFNDQANAESRMQQVRQQGFPAAIKQRIDTEPAWWLDFAVPVASTFTWRTWLVGRNDLLAKPIECF